MPVLPTVTVIADFRVDYYLPLPLTKEVLDAGLVYTSLRVEPAGTALHFATGGASILDVTVLGKIGRDPAGRLIQDRLTRECVRSLLYETDKNATGIVMTLMGDISAGGNCPDFRIASAPTASDRLTTKEIVEHADLLSTQDAVVIDGYRYLFQPSASASHMASTIARRAGVLTVFDMAPHDLPWRRTPIPIDEIVSNYDMVIAELPCILALLDRNLSRSAAAVPNNRGTAEAAITKLMIAYPSVTTWVVRFGAGNMESELSSIADGSVTYRSSGYCQAASKVGFGEYATCERLRDMLSNRRH